MSEAQPPATHSALLPRLTTAESFSTTDFVVVFACLVLVLLLSIPPLHHASSHLFSRKHQRKQIAELYEDEDGSATSDSQHAFSDKLPRFILVIASSIGTILAAIFLVSSYLGALCYLTGDKYSCQRKHDPIWIEQCFILPSWFFLLLQSCILFKTRQPVQRFRLGLYGGVSSFVLAIALPVTALQWTSKTYDSSAATLHSTLLFVESFLAFIMTFAFLLLPRRPNVYLEGKIVDQQFTVSALNRATFTWASPILSMAVKKKKINYDDLPAISDDVRARTLRLKFDNVGKKDKFWKTIFYSHKNLFLYQWSVQIVQSFANFVPQLTLFAILQALEARDRGEENRLRLWLLVIALGFSDAIFSWIENWLYYLSFLKIGNMVYEQIATVIFCKAVRKKDMKGISKVSDETQAHAQNGTIVINEDASHKDEDVDQDESVDDEVAKTKQSTINLIGVDGKRVADFAVYNATLLGCVTKLILAIIFLVKLVGWVSVLSGLAAFVAMAPFNYWITKNYTKTQDDLMKFRDQKMAAVTEALQGIRQIKFSALEKDWYAKILKTRKKELNTQWLVFKYDTALISIWIFGPVFLSAISLTVYALIHKELSPSIAFTTITVFESIEVTLAVIPEYITNLFDALISCNRIQEYLDSPNRSDHLKVGNSVVFRDATVSWPSDANHDDIDQEAFRLRDLNLAFPSGELSVISGRTGSGKSLLLSSIIGETDILDGTVYVPKAPESADRFDHKAHREDWIIKEAIAYVAQIPWIENATIKDNILFGLPDDEERYRKVLQASALEKDLEMLTDGDLTDIGANGINLSGGQKWRVSFARALYSRAGILVLDDIFSAVDAHVGKHLFEEALTGDLGRGRTRILVTHHVALCLPKTTYSVLLEGGTVLHADFTDTLRSKGLLKEILAYDVEELEKNEPQHETDVAATVDDGGSLQVMHSPGLLRRESSVTVPDEPLTRTKSAVSERNVNREPPKKFTEEEEREVGAIKLAIYKAYFQASGGLAYWAFVVFVFLLWSVTYLGRSYWVSVWTRESENESKLDIGIFQPQLNYIRILQSEFSQVKVDHNIYYYVGIYLAISLSQWAIGTGKYYFVFDASIKASKRLFEKLAFTILRAPLRFLDTTPVGRILNRFTADFNMIDSKIAYDLMFGLHAGMSALAVIVAAVFISPVMLVFAAALIATCLWFALRYLAGAREVKRLESNAKSPVFEQFGSVLHGIGTIRAFGKAEEYITKMEKKINTHSQAYFHLWLFNRWMSLRVSWAGAFFLTGMALLIVGIRTIDAPLAGFVLSFSLQLSECIIWLLRQYANVELDLNAVERVSQYSNMPIEDQGGYDAPAAWPTKGELEVNDLVVSYAADLPPVLRGLSFTVRQHERVGVVGRTGAGKSSLTLALFRFLEPQSGSIWIDGIDISKIKLFDLRSRLAIIPQDPVLFSGTIRSNLDPFNQHTDVELRDALARVHLIPSASASPSGSATPSNTEPSSASSTLGNSSTNVNVFTSLTSKISEGGLNLSQGQRQLLCLARAIVSRPKILVLDEATSSVDMETDALIQRSIREEFADSTLIVIAHRLSTIADFDRILVLGEGKVLEFDQPETLLKTEESAFRDMVESSGERRELESAIRQRHSR